MNFLPHCPVPSISWYLSPKWYMLCCHWFGYFMLFAVSVTLSRWRLCSTAYIIKMLIIGCAEQWTVIEKYQLLLGRIAYIAKGPVSTGQVPLSVYLSTDNKCVLCKNGQVSGVVDLVRNHVLDWGQDIPGKGNFLGGVNGAVLHRGRIWHWPCKKHSGDVISCYCCLVMSYILVVLSWS